MPTIRLYHGTSHAFDAFHLPGDGPTPNSSLGVHLTESPAIAADYADLSSHDKAASHGRVLVVDVDVTKVAIAGSRTRYLGIDPETDHPILDKADFADHRMHLLAEGYDAVATDGGLGDDLDGAWTILDPSRIRIVETLDPKAAYVIEAGDLSDGITFLSDPFFDNSIAALPPHP